jgi:hypothetical protein
MPNDLLTDNPFFYENATRFIDYFGWMTNIIILLFIIGVFVNKPAGFLFINFIVKVFLALFLIYRFNDYRKDKIRLTELDRKICFSVGVYILVFSFLDIIQSYVERLRHIIDPYTRPVVDKITSAFGVKNAPKHHPNPQVISH